MIQPARANEHGGIAQAASEAYKALGDYGKVIPSWMTHPGVEVYVDREEEERLRSFVLLGYFAPISKSSNRLIVDLLAIAVLPEYRGQGIGRSTLKQAVDLAQKAGKDYEDADLRLTVGEGNLAALHLFRSEGFEVLDPNHGFYDRGQRAIRMHRTLL